jgi:predicted DNA-binding ribbon-helix-helix protein
MIAPTRPSWQRRACGRSAVKSLIVKRSIVVGGYKTSVSLEDAFWQALKEIARARNTTLSEIVAAIDDKRPHGNLSSSIRLFVLGYYCRQLNPAATAHAPGADSLVRTA